ncbi:MAG: hypothetical protein KTR25_05130 [Myxococcales bacterium]|nr:hypothetical protein [Myxococcales bacterium]
MEWADSWMAGANTFNSQWIWPSNDSSHGFVVEGLDRLRPLVSYLWLTTPG